MGTWALLQVVVDIFAALGFFVIIMRMSRQPKDDPRLSRGLQLLQSKISVLEDLSDRTENQVSQLSALLDQKVKEVQAKVQIAERTVHEIKVSMERSLEVAKIFQDKIPHQEIIERQNTIKYVQAARLAHQGLNPEQIATQVDLPKGEIEFITKVNRDQLMFNEEQLPWWAREGAQNEDDGTELGASASAAASAMEQQRAMAPQPAQAYAGGPAQGIAQPPMQAQMQNQMQMHGAPAAPESTDQQAARLRAEIEMAERQRLYDNLSRLQFEMQNLDMQLARESGGRDLSGAFETPRVETNSLQKLGEEFRKACEDANAGNKPSIFPPLEQLTSLIPQIFQEGDMPAQVAPPASPMPMIAAAPIAQQQAPQQVQQQAPPQDPAQARAAAQAKVQAALARSAPAAARPAMSQTSADLAAARAMAMAEPVAAQMAPLQPQPQPQPAQQPMQAPPAQPMPPQQPPAGAQANPQQGQPSMMNRVINGRAQANQPPPVIRKVEFPKIEST